MFRWLIHCVGNGVELCVGSWTAFEVSFSLLFVKIIYLEG